MAQPKPESSTSSPYGALFESVLTEIKQNVWYSICRELDAKAGELYGLVLADTAARNAQTASNATSLPALPPLPPLPQWPQQQQQLQPLPVSSLMTPRGGFQNRPSSSNIASSQPQFPLAPIRKFAPNSNKSPILEQSIPRQQLSPKKKKAHLRLVPNGNLPESVMEKGTKSSKTAVGVGQSKRNSASSPPSNIQLSTMLTPETSLTLLTGSQNANYQHYQTRAAQFSSIQSFNYLMANAIRQGNLQANTAANEGEPVYSLDTTHHVAGDRPSKKPRLMNKSALESSATIAAEAEEEAEGEVFDASIASTSTRMTRRASSRPLRSTAQPLNYAHFNSPDISEDEGNNSSVTSHGSSSSKAGTGPRWFACNYDLVNCDFESNKRNNAYQHIRRVHFRLPPTEKEQLKRKIKDNRDANKYILELASPRRSSARSSAGTSAELKATPEQPQQQQLASQQELQAVVKTEQLADIEQSLTDGLTAQDTFRRFYLARQNRMVPPLPPQQPDQAHEPTVYKFFKEVSLNCLVDGCIAVLLTKEELNRHLDVDHGIKPFRCLLAGCGLSFENGPLLSAHIRDLHRTVKDFSCSRCESHISDHCSLQKHMSNFHSRGWFTCSLDDCAYGAEIRRDVLNHYKAAHSGLVTCAHCNTEFRNKKELDNHVKVTHTGRKGRK